MKVVTAAQVRQIDRACADTGLPSSLLMENAGKAFFEEAVRLLTGPAQQNIVMLVGPGNNGGDGLVAARYFHDRGAAVHLFLFNRNLPDDPNLKLALDRNLECTVVNSEDELAALKAALSSATLAVDAVLGTGSSRPLEGSIAGALEAVSEARIKRPELSVFALDIPTGLNADTGAADPACLKADNTITLAFPKRGFFNYPGYEFAGKISIVDIGIPAHMADDIKLELTTPDWARSVLPERPVGANKGTFGRSLVVAGSSRYIGAARLACSGVLRAGAGLVTLATPASLIPAIAAGAPEITYLPLPESAPGTVSPEAARLIREQLEGYDVLLAGCGLGQEKETVKLVEALLLEGVDGLPQLVLDADALNILSGVPDWWKRLPGNAILTPHPGEMARLSGTSVAEIQADRIGTAENTAREWSGTVVLKGAYTVTASPEGRVMINPSANPGLASAGTGDVLSGVIAGLAAQGLTAENAAACGVFIHGRAGERVSSRLGDAGMLASDLLPEIPAAIKEIKENTETAG